MERRQDSPYHRSHHVGHYDYKSDLVKQLEEAFEEFKFQLYQCYVKRYKLNHTFARNELLKIRKLTHKIRKEIHDHKQTIPRYRDNVHPSWEGIDLEHE